jgi:hypothetical protein
MELSAPTIPEEGTVGSTCVFFDASQLRAYYCFTEPYSAEHCTALDDHVDNPQHEPPDLLTVGELISLQDAADYAGLSRDSLQGYIRRGRLKAKKVGPIWVTTRAAIDEYLVSRNLENIPKKYRRSD